MFFFQGVLRSESSDNSSKDWPLFEAHQYKECELNWILLYPIITNKI